MTKKMKIRNLNKKYLKLHFTNERVESWNFLAINMTLQVKSQLNIRENNNSQEKEVMITKRKINTDPMRQYLDSLRKLNHPCLMGKLRREKRQRSSCLE